LAADRIPDRWETIRASVRGEGSSIGAEGNHPRVRRPHEMSRSDDRQNGESLSRSKPPTGGHCRQNYR
jgi:hypothetical protein